MYLLIKERVFSHSERRRIPTLSTHRRCKEVDTNVHVEKHSVEQHDVDEEEHENVPQVEEKVGIFSEDPHDISLLTHYVEHVAYDLWQNQISAKLEF